MNRFCQLKLRSNPECGTGTGTDEHFLSTDAVAENDQPIDSQRLA